MQESKGLAYDTVVFTGLEGSTLNVFGTTRSGAPQCLRGLLPGEEASAVHLQRRDVVKAGTKLEPQARSDVRARYEPMAKTRVLVDQLEVVGGS